MIVARWNYLEVRSLIPKYTGKTIQAPYEDSGHFFPADHDNPS